MRPPLAVVLLILAVPLMGSDCYVAGRVGGPPSPPPDDVVDPPPPGGGGGVIIVTSNVSAPPAPVSGATGIERSHLEAALAASVWTSPELEPVRARSNLSDPTAMDRISIDPTSIDPVHWEDDPTAPGETARPSSSAAVPEPTGIVLFTGGLLLASMVVRARRVRDD